MLTQEQADRKATASKLRNAQVATIAAGIVATLAAAWDQTAGLVASLLLCALIPSVASYLATIRGVYDRSGRMLHPQATYVLCCGTIAVALSILLLVSVASAHTQVAQRERIHVLTVLSATLCLATPFAWFRLGGDATSGHIALLLGGMFLIGSGLATIAGSPSGSLFVVLAEIVIAAMSFRSTLPARTTAASDKLLELGDAVRYVFLLTLGITVGLIAMVVELAAVGR